MLKKIISSNPIFILSRKTQSFSRVVRTLLSREEEALGFSPEILILFLIIHIALLNINVAEWGDSYRILRASEYIRNFSYPDDEKRPPLYSIVLALRPEQVDQVLWGRVLMLAISISSFVAFKYLLNQFSFSKKQQNIALLFFTLNPVYLYWSIRLMADVPFTLLVLLALIFLNKYKATAKIHFLALAGFVVGLAVLTRFEGYILGFALGLDLLLKKQNILNMFKKLFVFGLFSVITILPWFLFRNPLTSSYFEEPSGRSYDWITVWTYIASLVYVFGFVPAFAFFVYGFKNIYEFLSKNIGFATFLIIELFLALVWPAAIPRLFTPIVPLLLVLVVPQIFTYFESASKNVFVLFRSTALLGFFALSQFYLKLQFLILIKWVLFLTIFLQLGIIFTLYKKNLKMFSILTFSSMLLWTLSTIYIHKDIFKVVQEANIYASENLNGVIAYNDVSSVSDWHLNQKNSNDKISGYYLNMDSKKGRSLSKLSEERPDYLLITNEHNPTLEFDINEVDYLVPIKEFKYTIRGTEFFTKIAKVKYENK